jgi:excisionase family DNA binding protein
MHKRKNESTSEIQPLLLTIPQVAILLGMSKSKVYCLMNREGLPYVLIGDVKRVRRDKLDWWIEQRSA